MISKNDALLYAIRLYGAAHTFFETAYATATKIVNAVYNAFEPEYWVFFQSKMDPIPYKYVSLSAKGSLHAEWSYDATSLRFVPLIRGEHPTTTRSRAEGRLHVPILSLNIVSKEDGDEAVLYDLTDFLDTVRVYYVDDEELRGATPTISQLIGAWSISSGVVLDWSQDLFVTLINQNGVEFGVEFDKLHTPCATFNATEARNDAPPPVEEKSTLETMVVEEDVVTKIESPAPSDKEE